ncbi:putative P2X purinoceptor 7-like [Triplophysa rosa]|uniref:P2X purinoceptor 7-like n=1 Tax=Triplophysa rosa TaxID=992332 RepID=A0A9W8C801_TRIRA|nr:putative P2X purinoceptor 7-like [Triplophysa rosa]
MPTEAENVCCQEIEKVMTRILQAPTSLQCMTEHPGLESNCLSVYTLQNINNIYRADYGPLRRRMEHVRVVIPACVVKRIRQEFPDAGGNYVGFRQPLD